MPSDSTQVAAGVGTRIAGASFANLIGVGLRFVERFLVLGLIGRVLGADHLSDWLVLASVTAQAHNVDLGLGVYYSNLLAQKAARSEWEEYSTVWSTAVAAIGGLSATMAIAVAAATLALPIDDLLGLSAMADKRATAAFLLLALTFVCNSLTSFYDRVYRSVMATARAQWILNGRYVLDVVTPAIVLVAGMGIEAIAATRLMSSMALLVTFALDWQRLSPCRPAPLTWQMLRSATCDLRNSVGLFICQSSRSWLGSLSLGLVSNRIGTHALLPYSTSLMMANFCLSLASSVSAGLYQEVARFVWRDAALVRRLCVRSFRFLLGTSMVAMTAFLFLYGDVSIAWLGSAAPSIPFVVAALQFAFVVTESTRVLPYTVAMSQNLLRPLLIASCLSFAGLLIVVPAGSGAISLAAVVPLVNAFVYVPTLWRPLAQITGLRVSDLVPGAKASLASCGAVVVAGLAASGLSSSWTALGMWLRVGLVGSVAFCAWQFIILGKRERQATKAAVVAVALRLAPRDVGVLE